MDGAPGEPITFRWKMQSIIRVSGVVAALAVMQARVAAAQGDELATIPAREIAACKQAPDPNKAVTLDVYLTLHVPTASSPAGVAMLRRVAEDAASRARLALGAAPDAVPHISDRFPWHEVHANVDLVVRSDGSASVIEPTVTRGEESEGRFEAFLRRTVRVALDSARPGMWEASGVDSVRAGISTFAPKFFGDVASVPPLGVEAPLGEGVPIFTMPFPRFEGVVPVSAPVVAFPSGARAAGARARVRLEFVVGPDGRVRRDAIFLRSVQANDPGYERAFVSAARTAISGARYRAARLGRCTLSWPVTQEIVF